MAKLSVIVPVYNIKKHLTQCVDSIRSQTFTDWELILVDDGSWDGSGALCDRLAEEDSRIRVIHQENGGVSKARNTGMEAATGQFFTFVDGDDFVDPKMYEKLMCSMEAGNDIVFCRFLRSYEDSNIYHREIGLSALAETPWDYSKIIYELHFASWENGTESDTVFGSVCRSLFRRDIIREKGLQFPAGVRIAEDRLFLMAYLAHARTGDLVDEYLYYYRADRQDSATAIGTAGYQAHLFERKKTLLDREIPLIWQNPCLSNSTKWELIVYERYRLAFDVALNEILYNPDHKQRLRQLFREDLLRNAIGVKSFLHMIKTGLPAKRMVLYVLIGLRWWNCLAKMLKSRRRQK